MSPEEQLKQFRALQRPDTLAIGTNTWTWFDSRGAQPALMLLSGGFGDGESFFQLFAPLAIHYRVLAASVPPSVTSVRAAIDGLAALMDHLQIDKTSLYGHSQGGYLAQRLLSDKPARVANLILSATCLPSERHARIIERQLRIVRILPDAFLRIAAAAQFKRIVRRDAPTLSAEERRFWLGYFVEGLQVKGLRSRVEASARLQLDYHRGPIPTGGDPRIWNGRVLIITYGQDSLISKDDAARLIEHYPAARHVDLLEQGHLGPIVDTGALLRLLATMTTGFENDWPDPEDG